MRWIGEAGGGVEHRAACAERVGRLESALGDPVGDDPGELADQGVDVRKDDVACVRGERSCSESTLGVIRSPPTAGSPT